MFKSALFAETAFLLAWHAFVLNIEPGPAVRVLLEAFLRFGVGWTWLCRHSNSLVRAQGEHARFAWTL